MGGKLYRHDYIRFFFLGGGDDDDGEAGRRKGLLA